MTEDEQRRLRRRMRFALVLAVLTVLLAIVIIPPLINVSRYRGQIAHLISVSLGRPVRLGSVELRVLPRPGFVLTDLTVEEDPAYGAEPVLHANAVTASIRLSSLWRGLQVSRISVDEASFNLVRGAQGGWNIDSLFLTASQPKNTGAGILRIRKAAFPYLEATGSRVNIKSGVEKLPYSLIDADLALWQDEPGVWRVRVKGQPARTDLSLDQADTGELRVEAEIHRAPMLRRAPIHLIAEWREAQLGQLTRLLAGSDAGWRGDLTGQVHLDGTLDAATVTTRLSASNVHRAEFAPPAPMDFDANCAFVFHYTQQAIQGLDCSSALGDGRVRLTGDMPAAEGLPQFTLELDRLPVPFVLDALRTVRSGVLEDLSAKGAISGRISYAAAAPLIPRRPVRLQARAVRGRQPAPGPLSGSLTVQGLELSGAGIDPAIRIAKVVLEPAPPAPGDAAGRLQGLAANAIIPLGVSVPLTVTSRWTLAGYSFSVHGQASLARLRTLAHAAGLNDRSTLGTLTGDAASIDLTASGPWLAPEQPVAGIMSAVAPAAVAAAPDAQDQFSGTFRLENAAWSPSFLAHPVDLNQATLHLDNHHADWNPVAFTYGPVKGTASLTTPLHCAAPDNCTPSFRIQFGDLNASEFEAAIFGAQEPGTLLSGIIARITPSSTPSWPHFEGAVTAESLVLGPVTLEKPEIGLRIEEKGAKITQLDAGLLGGAVHGTGTVLAAGAEGNPSSSPAYSFDLTAEHLSPQPIGQLFGQRWTGGEIKGAATLALSGFTAHDLATSAKGNLHFDWYRGSVVFASDAGADSDLDVPAALARFDHWAADAEIADGAATLKQNQVRRGARRASVTARVTFAEPPVVSFAASKEIQSAKR